MDHYNGTADDVNSFRQSTQVTYPLCLNASSIRSAYQAYQGNDVSIVIDQQGTIRYKKAGVNVSEIKIVIDGLLATAINEDAKPDYPGKFELNQNYPNPFNPSTTITFNLPQKESVSLEVFSIVGQRVARLFSGELQKGRHSFVFDASHLPSGIYFYKLRSENQTAVHRMILNR